MSVIKQGLVRNLHTRVDDDFSIEHGLNLQYAFDAQRDWSISLASHLLKLKNALPDPGELTAALQEFGIEHSHWNWANKSLIYDGPEYEWFYTLVGGEVQAIALIFHPKESRIDKQSVFYIEYISLAPWNRDSRVQSKRYGGLGKELIRSAVDYSISKLKYRPGFCLHSLPQTEGYYGHIGMIDFGVDTGYHNLKYFEMDDTTALKLI